MSFAPAICPKCDQFILLKIGKPFLVCPVCEANISAREASMLLDATCANPRRTNEIVAKCLKTQEEYNEIELSLKVLTVLNKHFPQNEEVAYLVVKMSGYASVNVKEYLTSFAETKRSAAFAEEFLAKALKFNNMACAVLFAQYIENKLPTQKQQKWKSQLADMLRVYKGDSSSTKAVSLIYTYYVVFSVVNVAMAVTYVFLHFWFLINVFIALAAFMAEVGLLFWHNKRFGNRMEVSDKERLLMVIFMSSIVLNIGGVLLAVFI